MSLYDTASPALKSTWIGVFVGSYISAILYGVTAIQTFSYFKHIHKESANLKRFVLLLWLLDSMDTCIVPFAVFHVDIAAPELAISEHVYWAFSVSYCIEAVIEGLVRIFYCIRIWQLSRSVIVTLIPVVLSLAAQAFALWLGIQTFFLDASQVRSFQIGAYGFTISSFVTDIVITIILSCLLWSQRPQVNKTRSVVNHLIAFTVSNGAITSVGALVVLVTYLASPGLAYSGIRFIVPKLFVNAFLAMLNNRDILRQKLDGSSGVIMSLDDRSRGYITGQNAGSGGRSKTANDTLVSPGQPSPKDHAHFVEISTDVYTKFDPADHGSSEGYAKPSKDFV